MSPMNNESQPDQLYYGYRESTRAVLRHLILEMQLKPSHPLVAAFEHHLFLTTAHAELTRAFMLGPPVNIQRFRSYCYQGCDFQFVDSNQVASSLYDDEEDSGCCYTRSPARR